MSETAEAFAIGCIGRKPGRLEQRAGGFQTLQPVLHRWIVVTREFFLDEEGSRGVRRNLREAGPQQVEDA